MSGKITRTAGRFLRDARGGATSIAAVGAIILAVSGGALIIDHNQLVGQRDMLKAAADAASLAATLELNEMPSNLSERQMQDRVLAVATKYAVLNVLGNTTDPDTTVDDVEVTFNIDRDLQIVRVSVGTGTDATLLSNWLHGYYGPDTVLVRSGVEADESSVELVLAIDQSGSMKQDLHGVDVGHTDPSSRMSIVKQAATALVDALRPRAGGNIAIGIVPWDARVRLDGTTRETWAGNNWAEYPDSRHYAATYACRPKHTCDPPAEDNDLPASPPTWEGCLDLHRVSSEGHADIVAQPRWFDHPGSLAFAQSIYPAAFGRSYECLREPVPADLKRQRCYAQDVDHIEAVQGSHRPQRCAEKRSILPLTTDREAIIAHIDGWAPDQSGTNSGLGLLWGQRLLSSHWRDVWGDPVLPRDAGDDVRKAIVLLTDGADTQCGEHDPDCSRSDLGHSRAAICAAVKAAGTEVFVVAAMLPEDVSGELGAGLTSCSSQGERTGTYAFVGSESGESIRAAFQAIAHKLRSVRRIY